MKKLFAFVATLSIAASTTQVDARYIEADPLGLVDGPLLQKGHLPIQKPLVSLLVVGYRLPGGDYWRMTSDYIGIA